MSYQPDLTDQEVGSTPTGMDDFSCEEGSSFKENGNNGGVQQKWAIPAYRSGPPHMNRALGPTTRAVIDLQ